MESERYVCDESTNKIRIHNEDHQHQQNQRSIARLDGGTPSGTIKYYIELCHMLGEVLRWTVHDDAARRCELRG